MMKHYQSRIIKIAKEPLHLKSIDKPYDVVRITWETPKGQISVQHIIVELLEGKLDTRLGANHRLFALLDIFDLPYEHTKENYNKLIGKEAKVQIVKKLGNGTVYYEIGTVTPLEA